MSGVDYAPYIGEDPARVRIAVTTIGDLLLTSADRWPDKPAVIFPDSRRTYAELAAAAIERARGLIALGVKPGDHVGILMPTGVDFSEVFFGVAMTGAVAVLMNARYKPAELSYVAGNADLVTIVTTDAMAEHLDFVERLEDAFPDLPASQDARALQIDAAPRLRSIVLLGAESRPGFLGEAAFVALAGEADVLAVHHARLGVRIRDVGMILYTSGTSANPKGCLLSHEAIVRNSINLGRHRWQFGPDDVVWSPLPLFHIAAMLPLLSILDVGGTYVGQAHFEAGEGLAMIRDHRATAIFAPFVTFLQALIYHPDFATTDLTGVRVMNSCFAVMPSSVGDAYRQAMPDTLQVGTYGMTETSGIVSTGNWRMDRELGFTRLGDPLLGLSVRIVGRETGEDLPAGEQGEILVRGYSVLDGYYRDPAKTAEAIDAEGWYHSGDIGSVDANGHVMFHGRTKDMLKVGGENVAAAEVEAVLQRAPGVKLAQVVGIPDDRLAEIPAAFIELEPGAEVDPEALIALCRREMASFKAPRHIRFVDEWPMSASKIQKFRLRKQLLEELGIAE